MNPAGAISDFTFFAFAVGIVGAAISAVTIKSPKSAVFAFSLFCLFLGGMFFWLGLSFLAIAQSAIGIVALIVYQVKFKGHGERADDEVRMLASPNQMVAVFVLLCFVMAVTPVWIYSVWSPQAGEAPTNITATIFNELNSRYFPALLGWLLALGGVALFAYQIRRVKAVTLNRDNVTDKEFSS
jgi:NADH:ubiquinone oxidoreductase subunit 6 (subunit J)